MCSGSFRSRSKGPPGIRRTRKNVMVTTQKRTTTKPTVLFAINRIIGVVQRSPSGLRQLILHSCIYAHAPTPPHAATFPLAFATSFIIPAYAHTPKRPHTDPSLLVYHHRVDGYVWRELLPSLEKL